MEWLQIAVLILVALLLLRFIRKMLFKVIWVAIIVMVVLYFFTDVNFSIPW